MLVLFSALCGDLNCPSDVDSRAGRGALTAGRDPLSLADTVMIRNPNGSYVVEMAYRHIT
jgi:hypothetical protein